MGNQCADFYEGILEVNTCLRGGREERIEHENLAGMLS